MSTNKSIIKSAGLIGAATSLSRVLGFIRDMVIANFFGTGAIAQAFVVAFRIPNLLRDIVGEGATNAAFVPVFSEELAQKGKQDFFKLAQVVFNILFLTLFILTVLGILFSPVIIRMIAPGFYVDKEKFDLTVTLTRIMFPFLLLIGLWAFAMGALNTMEHFAAPAFGSCALNLMIIICAAWFGENVFGLTSGVLIGGLLQLLMQFPPLYLRGWRFRFTKEFFHPKAKRIGMLLIPRALGSSVYQFNVIISTILASFSDIVGKDAVAILYYANRLWQLPLAIFGRALAQAALPAMSKQAALKDMEKLKGTILFSLKVIFFILLPACIGLMVLSTPITRLLFERGAFKSDSTLLTSKTLFYYAIGLVACGGGALLSSAFYALQDTKTPLKIAIASFAVNLGLNLWLMWPLKVGGLALANSISTIFNCIMLYAFLRKKIGTIGISRVLDSMLKISLAGLFMGIACYFFSGKINILINIVISITVYFMACYFLEARELKELLSWILKRK